MFKIRLHAAFKIAGLSIGPAVGIRQKDRGKPLDLKLLFQLFILLLNMGTLAGFIAGKINQHQNKIFAGFLQKILF